ncbi:phosphodiester glycosidase family protein [Clostridium estertheticum]|uniref:phosphodiester glycosidase family protein n=1 Tax=Clostridium estertheticum TaxID=238834 RepID=UPI001CF16A76|nr:phosphodiester glycosidase family protein [Clostridium estertheticum]MCB2305056.1 phosphodiester glycosidase family protein [Clostridium estertheticum]MCB2343674.1 phosphodiester glycosidase family protein [Clostridium estertheticum]MCB2348593.1 phosphodiester glycosidase family protein [Clostridium estertheticum]WAG47536.1 phosphodiester glycosidase family protein [Clostridium estertheticum]
MRKIKKRRKTKKRTSTLVLLFVIFELIFTTITGPFMLYYGPFKNVKSTVVGAAMTTYSLQWLATTFLSKEAIAKIMSDQTVDTLVQNNLDGVKVENKNDDSIERYDVKGNKFKGYILIINDPTRLKVGYSSMLRKEGQITSDIAKDNNAIAAINGGGFKDEDNGSKWTGTGANPTGIIMSNGKTAFNDITDVDKKTEVVAMTSSGKLLVGPHSLSEMKTEGVTDAVSFGPALIVSGQKTITKGDGGWGIAPRTCVAQRKDGAIIFLVIDGRQAKSLGATLREAQDVLYDYGAVNASNLDGGSSSTLFYDDEIINSPSDSLGERSVPSIMYIESRK